MNTLIEQLLIPQALSILYYASCAWLTPILGRREMDEVEKIHYRALRIVLKDYKQRMNRDLISSRTNCLPPRVWSKFACASFTMKMWYSGLPNGLKTTAFSNTFTKSRYPGLLFGFDSSKTKVGRQMTKNWCGSVLSQIKVPWHNTVLSKDRIRLLLKSVFYPHNFIVFDF